eukprot:14364088-Alexandrium_andersonii.AAC.1
MKLTSALPSMRVWPTSQLSSPILPLNLLTEGLSSFPSWASYSSSWRWLAYSPWSISIAPPESWR